MRGRRFWALAAMAWLWGAGPLGAGLVIQQHRVQPGETLEAIAQQYGAKVEEIVERNPWLRQGEQVRELKAGEVISVPVGSGSRWPSPSAPASQTSPPSRHRLPLRMGSRGEVEGVVGILLTRTPIYRQPTQRSSMLYRCEAQQRVVVVQERGEWLGLLMLDGSVGWVPAQNVQLTETRVVGRRQVPEDAGFGARVVAQALRYLGVPYRYGGESLQGIDCSAFVQRVFRECGRSLPRTAAQQYQVGVPVSPSELQPGDRLYFRRGAEVDHTGIYIGSGQFVHASSRAGGVTVDSLADPRYWGIFVGARR